MWDTHAFGWQPTEQMLTAWRRKNSSQKITLGNCIFPCPKENLLRYPSQACRGLCAPFVFWWCIHWLDCEIIAVSGLPSPLVQCIDDCCVNVVCGVRIVDDG